MTDREIIEWVAQAQIGDAVPVGLNQLCEVIAAHGAPIARGDALDGHKLSAWARTYLDNQTPTP